ncbi:MAG: hypothetical protein ACM30G_22965 [Micromonosporaceae bacterium]
MALLTDPDPSWEGPVTHAPQKGGRHRRVRARSVLELIALVVALVGVIWLLTLPAATNSRGETPGPPPLAEVWPGVAPSSQPALLADGTIFTPQLYLDAATAVGTAPTGNADQVRVLVRTSGGVRELRRVNAKDFPQFAAFSASGDDVFWAESTSPANQAQHTRLYRANWRTGTRSVLVTADTGDMVFTESQFDLTVSGGRLRWVSAEFVTKAVTQVRSVPVGGGTVAISPIDGAYTLSAWPWLVTFGNSSAAQPELVNVESSQRVKLTTTPAEVARCSPVWCRIVVLGGDAVPVRIDLQHPDGSQRHRIAGADTSAVIGDVALLDRFEPLGVARTRADDVGRQLILYDIKTGRLVDIAPSVDVIRARQGVLWWSTGSGSGLIWHALDLRQLT